jgi:hypothetical protein
MVVMTISVVIRSEVAVVDGAGVGVGVDVGVVMGPIEMLDGQLVMMPGFWGMKSPQTPTRYEIAAWISLDSCPQDEIQE